MKTILGFDGSLALRPASVACDNANTIAIVFFMLIITTCTLLAFNVRARFQMLIEPLDFEFGRLGETRTVDAVCVPSEKILVGCRCTLSVIHDFPTIARDHGLQ